MIDVRCYKYFALFKKWRVRSSSIMIIFVSSICKDKDKKKFEKKSKKIINYKEIYLTVGHTINFLYQSLFKFIYFEMGEYIYM